MKFHGGVQGGLKEQVIKFLVVIQISGSRPGLGRSLRSPSAWNMMTVCGYLVAKEHHRMHDYPNCESGLMGAISCLVRDLHSLSAAAAVVVIVVVAAVVLLLCQF